MNIKLMRLASDPMAGFISISRRVILSLRDPMEKKYKFFVPAELLAANRMARNLNSIQLAFDRHKGTFPSINMGISFP